MSLFLISQEPETAIRLGMQLVALILNDSSLGMIRWKQANMGFADWGLEFDNPNFVAYAESYGAKGHRIESTEHLSDGLTESLDAPGVYLIDCPIDYSDNDRILDVEIKEKSAAI